MNCEPKVNDSFDLQKLFAEWRNYYAKHSRDEYQRGKFDILIEACERVRSLNENEQKKWVRTEEQEPEKIGYYWGYLEGNISMRKYNPVQKGMAFKDLLGNTGKLTGWRYLDGNPSVTPSMWKNMETPRMPEVINAHCPICGEKVMSVFPEADQVIDTKCMSCGSFILGNVTGNPIDGWELRYTRVSKKRE